jgi:hypothetical protein
VQFTFTKILITISGYVLDARNCTDNSGPNSWKIEGLNHKNKWVLIDDQQDRTELIEQLSKKYLNAMQ